MWPNIDIDNGINHDDIIFYNNPDRSNSEKLQYLEHKFPGTGFSENPSIYSGSKGTYVRGFHLNERIASFLLLDPAIPQPIFEIISNSFIENFCNGSREKDVIQNKAKHLSYEEIYKEKFIQIKYRLLNLYSDEGYDRSDNRAPKCAQQIIFYQCILKNIECGTVKEIKWRLQNVGEAFSIYKKNNNNTAMKITPLKQI
ncbi:hypothetical protein ACTFIR_003770 [Dictyostelium discoideum]